MDFPIHVIGILRDARVGFTRPLCRRESASGLPRGAKAADLMQARGLQVCIAATGDQLVENGGMAQMVIVHGQDGGRDHLIDSKRLQLVGYRRVQVRQSGYGRGPTGPRAAQKGIAQPKGRGPHRGWFWHGRLGTPRLPRCARALSSKIGLPVSHHATTGNCRPDGSAAIPSACGQTGREAGPGQTRPLPRREPASTRSSGPKPS